jgi:hypothetical protein
MWREKMTMSKPTKIIIVGLILLIGGMVGGVASFFATIQDPSEIAEETLEFESGGTAKTIKLDKGEYDIWFEPGLFGSGDPGTVMVGNNDAGIIYEGSSSSTTETITINNKEYEKAGSFEIKSSGSYDVYAENSCKLHITPTIDVALGLGICMTGVVIGLIGGIILLVGIISHFSKKKRERQKTQHPPQQYPPQQYPPQQYPPQQPPQQYPCRWCQQPMVFVNQYQKWYCERCQKYA